MIHKFEKWRILESFGDKKETFTETLDLYGKQRNLTFFKLPSEWGEEIQNASGKIIYSAFIETDKAGIENIFFNVNKIEIQLEILQYEDNKEKIVYKDLVYDENKLPSGSQRNSPTENVKIDFKESLPFYVTDVEIDFSQSENLEGDVDEDLIEYTVHIGKSE